MSMCGRYSISHTFCFDRPDELPFEFLSTNSPHVVKTIVESSNRLELARELAARTKVSGVMARAVASIDESPVFSSKRKYSQEERERRISLFCTLHYDDPDYSPYLLDAITEDWDTSPTTESVFGYNGKFSDGTSFRYTLIISEYHFEEKKIEDVEELLAETYKQEQEFPPSEISGQGNKEDSDPIGRIINSSNKYDAMYDGPYTDELPF